MSFVPRVEDEACNREALAYANEMVESRPEDGISWILKGNCHYRLGELEEAQESYQRAAVLGELSSHSHFLSASCLVEMGRIEDAVPALRSQLKITPDHPDALFLLALCLRLLDEREESDALLERIRDIDTEFYEEMFAKYTELLAKGTEDPLMRSALQGAARVLRKRE